MSVIFIRTCIIFFVLIVVMRLMGKRQIGEMQPFEFVVTLIIADLACIPMADVSIPLIYGLAAVFTLFLLHQLLSLLEQSGNFIKRLISGEPSVVIDRNGVCFKELRRNNMDVGDLIESMRAMGYFSLDDLTYAIFESNGKLSPFENSERQKTPESVPVVLISNGRIDVKNLELINAEKQEIDDFLAKFGGKLKNTEVMTVDGNGRCYLKLKNTKYQIAEYPLKEGAVW